MNDLKDELLKRTKGILKTTLKSAIAILLIILVAFSGLFIILGAFYKVVILNDASYKEGKSSNLGYVTSQKATSAVKVENISRNTNGDGWNLGIDLDKAVDEIIEEVNNNDGRIDSYISKTNQKEYLKAFIKAELITQYPDLRSKDKIGTEYDENELQGCIQVRRLGSGETSGEGELLTYVDYNTFQSYIDSNDETATKHFTLDNNENLIVAGWTRKTTNITSNIEGVENVNNKVEYSLNTTPINYKPMLKSYSMPFDFLWALTVMGHEEDFAYEIAQLALNSKIVITVHDNLSTTIEDYKEEYKIQSKKVLSTQGVNKPYSLTEDSEEKTDPYSTHTNVKTENCTAKLDITYADCWIAKYKNTYTNNIKGETQTDDEEKTEKDTNYEKLPNTDKYIRVTNKNEFENINRNLYTKYKNDGNKDEDIPKIIIQEAYYTRTIDKKTTSKKTNSYNEYIQGTPVVEEKTDPKSTEPNFVTIFNKYTAMRQNLPSIVEWLIESLEKSEKTANMTDTVRYLFYKATGTSYGVTEFNTDMFIMKNMTQVLSKQGLSSYLRQFSHSGEAPQSVDGKYYLLYGDGKGWPTIGNADLQWASHHRKFNKKGKILQNGKEKEVKNVEEYVNSFLTKGVESDAYSDSEVYNMQVYIDKALVDEIGDSIWDGFYKGVKSDTDGLNLSKQQLYPLVAIAGNFGSLPERNGYTFRQVYMAGAKKYEINSWEHNKFIWDNWWAYLGGGAAGHIPARDAAFETYVKGVYDFSQSDAGDVFGRKYYIYYTQQQINNFSYAPSKTITRNSSNEKEIFTYEEKSGNSDVVDFALQFVGENHSRFTSYRSNTPGVEQVWSQNDWCAMFVSYCYDQCGLIPSILPRSYSGAGDGARYQDKVGRFKYSGSYIPNPGDIIYFQSSSYKGVGDGMICYHTGIVESCDGTNVYTIEGNASGSHWSNSKVCKCCYRINDSDIFGYGTVN